MYAERTAPPGMARLRARDSVDAAFTRLEAAVAQRGLTVFARLDFAADAAAVGLTLPPTRLLLFGNPRAGTLLMAAAPTAALDLPLKVLIWEVADGSVWVDDGDGLRAVETPYGRLGGLVCWENYMPLARFALYESGIELYVASTADDSEEWQSTLVHIARESRCFVIAPSHFQRAASYPDDFPLARLLEGVDMIGRGGSAILAPDGSYLAGPLWDEEGVLYAELDPAQLDGERQRFDPTGHYHRPDVFRLDLTREG